MAERRRPSGGGYHDDDVEEGLPLMTRQLSPASRPSPLADPSSPPAVPGSPTSYQAIPRSSTPIPSSPSPLTSHYPQGVLARLNNYLKLGKAEDEEEEERRRQECGWFYCEWRAKLGHWLEGRRVQYFFISLLVLDIVLLTCELAFEEYFAKEDSEKWVLMVKDVFEYASVGILLVFAVEVVLLVISFDISFFTHPFYVIDAIIIGVSLFFDLYLKEALASFLVVFRFWRVVRVVHSIVAAEEERHGDTKREKRHLEAQLVTGQGEIDDLKQRLAEKDRELERMRQKCDALERQLKDNSEAHTAAADPPPPAQVSSP